MGKGMSSVHVVFLNTSLTWGGGEKWHLETARMLAGEGHQVTVLCHPRGALAQAARRHRLITSPLIIRNLSFLDPLCWWRLMHWLRRQGVSTLVINSPAEVKLAASAAHVAGVKQVIFRRGMPHPLGDNVLHRWLFRRCITHVIANSLEVARSLNARNPDLVPADKIRVIYNGLDIDSFSGVSHQGLLQRRPGEILLGNAGRLVKQKNQQVLLEMALALKQVGLPFRLLIAGEGMLKEQLETRCQALGLEQEVQFLGFQEDIRPFLASLDIFVFPSLYEGSANALIEAAAVGLPVVAFDISSNPEVVEDGRNGYLVPVNDTPALTERVLQLMQSPDLRKQMGEVGRSRVKAHFSAQQSRRRVCELIS